MLTCRLRYRAGFCREGSVFPDAEGRGEGFKMESEAQGEGATRAANENAGAVAFAAGTARGAQGVLGSAGGCDGPGNPAGPVMPSVLESLAAPATWLTPGPQHCSRVTWLSPCHSVNTATGVRVWAGVGVGELKAVGPKV